MFIIPAPLTGCGDADDAARDAVSDTDVATPEVVEPFVATLEGWSVSAGEPVLDGATVRGSMTLTRESGGETRGGGVCLVADLADAFPCTSVADCAALPAPPEGGFHYCAGVNGSATKTCWTRPGGGDVYCARSPSNAPGTVTTPAAPSVVGGEPTTWMSYACLAIEGNAAGCGTGEPSQFTVATSTTLVVTAVPSPP